MRIFHQKNSVGVEYYDNDLKIRSKRKINMELPLWGGFYAGSDGYYLVEGQTNNKENDSAEVIRVIRYDTNWNRNGAAAITSNPELFGGEVRTPFDYGCVEMTESNGKLYVVTGHEGYVDPSVGQGHQGFLMAEIDQATMKGKIVSCDLWHSFAQAHILLCGHWPATQALTAWLFPLTVYYALALPSISPNMIRYLKTRLITFICPSHQCLTFPKKQPLPGSLPTLQAEEKALRA